MDWIKAWLGIWFLVVVQLPSRVWLCDSMDRSPLGLLSLTIFQSLPKFLSIELAMLFGSLLFTRYVEGDKKGTQGQILALGVQWLRLRAPNAGGSDSVPGWVARSLIPQLKNDPACQNKDRRPCSTRTKTQHKQIGQIFFFLRTGQRNDPLWEKWSTDGLMCEAKGTWTCK